MQSINYDLMVFLSAVLETISPGLSLQMDYLPDFGDAISFQPNPTQKILKQYINGAKVLSHDFTLLAVTDGDNSSEPNLRASEWLSKIAKVFSAMEDFELSESRRILKSDIRTPSILQRTQDGRLVYSTDILINYEEH